MTKTNDGAIYGVTNIKYNGVALGLISEDGLQPGGEAPSKTRVWSAQKRNAPFAVIKSNAGVKMWSFVLIELLAKNMVQVMGGKEEEDGSYTPPTEDKEIEGVFDIETTSGHTLRINKGLLTCTFTNGINFGNVLGISCELEMQEAGEDPAFKIFAPGVEPPAVGS